MQPFFHALDSNFPQLHRGVVWDRQLLIGCGGLPRSVRLLYFHRVTNSFSTEPATNNTAVQRMNGVLWFYRWCHDHADSDGFGVDAQVETHPPEPESTPTRFDNYATTITVFTFARVQLSGTSTIRTGFQRCFRLMCVVRDRVSHAQVRDGGVGLVI
jgi:hypothetical protein